MKIRLFLLLILLCQSLVAFSETFIVTSNADSGTGTLREAIDKANANGTSEVDYIHFNLPGSLASDHVIKVLSDFPEITSSVVIDASTQAGQEASANHAKVIIDGTDRVYSPQRAQLFRVNGVDRFELYGIVIRNFLYNFGISTSSITAIEFSGINGNVIFGAPGKGNVFYNVYGIYVKSDHDDPKHQIQSLTLKANYFGVKENGIDIPPLTGNGLNITRVYTLTIGGVTAEEGNVINGGTSFYLAQPGEMVTRNVAILIRNNVFGANINGDRPGITAIGHPGHIFSADANLNHTATVNVEVTDNVYGAILSFQGLDNCNIGVSRNFFGTSRNQSTKLPMMAQAMNFYHCNGKILVGGTSTAEGNVITNTSAAPIYPKDQFGITAEYTSAVELSHNTLYCNPGIPFLYTYTGPFNKPLDVFLKEKTATYVAGTTKAGARVELYYTDPECTNCQPKRYFATVTADGSGNWRYDGVVETGVSVMASATLNQVTSEFSDPRIYMFQSGQSALTVTHQTCDNTKGKIEGAFTVNADKVEWVNETGDVVGNTLDIDLFSGKYKLRANQFGCIVESEWIVIENQIPQLAFGATQQLIHPSCGNGGSILNLFPNYYSELEWLDENGIVKGVDRELINVPAGTYTLRLTGSTGCVKNFGPYTLLHQTGPAINQSLANVQGSACNTSTGYIKNIEVTGTGIITYKWKNAAGDDVGNALELLNVPTGVYTLEVKDESACPALFSAPIAVSEINGISIDASTVTFTKSTCNTSNGSITGITTTGATGYKWLDAGGTTVATTLSLTGMPPGKYRLVASNSTCDKTSEEFTIEMAQSALNYGTTKILTNATCGLANGKIEAIFSHNQPSSCFWKNAGGQIIGHSRILENQPPGAYDLYFVNDLGCTKFAQQYSISNTQPANINPGSAMVTNDQCGFGKGQITAPLLSGGQRPYFYEWKDKDGRIIGSSPVLSELKAGDYRLTVGDALECGRQTFTYTVLDQSASLPTPVVNDIKVCSAGKAVVQVMAADKGSYTIYDDSGKLIETSNTGTFKLDVAQTQTYTVVMQQGNCQSAPATVKVTIENDGIGKLANAFSPNSDGQNDEWLIPGIINYPTATVSIYNRYGVKVFDAVGYKTPFNGRSGGADLPIGTYYYIIDLKRGCGLQKGSLTIIR
ncbi:gliding motility-associated C-terminal domain-containing protein [Pedobacter frigoris]|uniref:gliding motility-associated C-terminal domain-containing protein n=1 Tax=Pedobacter frigoris TaxID=2571272 RepID=UPI00292E35D2|nr:gliding motility-associated C-terminal domain-containing protein [Pedobacter frigoris]